MDGKKKIALFGILCVTVVAFAACGQGNREESEELTEEEAKAKVLAAEGVTEEELTGFRIEKDNEDGRYIYDVEFYTGNQEYDYEIDRYNGSIISRDFDIEQDFPH